MGKFVELTTNRDTRTFTSRGAISFPIEVTPDRLAGSATAKFFSFADKPLEAPINTATDRTRVKLLIPLTT